MSRKTINLKYSRTKKGLVSRIYNHQKGSSKRRDDKLPTYTKQEFQEWLYSQKLFHELFEQWKISGYKKDLYPSCDRTDSHKIYSLDNIQLMTWQENSNKENDDRKNGINNKMNKAVLQFDLQGNLLKKYHSLMDAQRQTGCRQESISRCCRGIYKTTGNYKWQFNK